SARAAGYFSASVFPMPTCCAPCPGNKNAILLTDGSKLESAAHTHNYWRYCKSRARVKFTPSRRCSQLPVNSRQDVRSFPFARPLLHELNVLFNDRIALTDVDGHVAVVH